MVSSLTTMYLEVQPSFLSHASRGYCPRVTTTDPDKSEFGKRLKKAREACDLTQLDVAKRFDVGKGTVSAWENGGGDPGALRLGKLARMYRTTADALLGGEASRQSSYTELAREVADWIDALEDDDARLKVWSINARMINRQVWPEFPADSAQPAKSSLSLATKPKPARHQ